MEIREEPEGAGQGANGQLEENSRGLGQKMNSDPYSGGKLREVVTFPVGGEGRNENPSWGLPTYGSQADWTSFTWQEHSVYLHLTTVLASCLHISSTHMNI